MRILEEEVEVVRGSGDYIYAVGVPSWSSSSGYLNSFDLGAGHPGVQSIKTII